jgi:hypothetical protein
MHEDEHKRIWAIIALVIVSFGLAAAAIDVGVPQRVEAAARVVVGQFGFYP